MTRILSRALLPLFLGGLLLWSSWQVVCDLQKTSRNYREVRWSERLPSGWRFGTPAVEGLRSFAAEVEERVPPGEVVAFTSLHPEGSPPMMEFVRFLWASYLLPRHRLLRAVGPESLAASSYWVTYGTTRNHSQAEPIWQSPQGAIYRLSP